MPKFFVMPNSNGFVVQEDRFCPRTEKILSSKRGTFTTQEEADRAADELRENLTQEKGNF